MGKIWFISAQGSQRICRWLAEREPYLYQLKFDFRKYIAKRFDKEGLKTAWIVVNLILLTGFFYSTWRTF